jgi:uncharacterized alkaline shock family protein YloU
MAAAPDPVAGEIVVSDEAVAQLAGLTVESCYGVVDVAATRFVHGVARRLGREATAAGVEVERLSGEAVRIEVRVIVEHGLNVAEVAANVRTRVAYDVERLAGLQVADVAVHVVDVRPEGR